MADLKFAVAQIGARRHYAIPRALQAQGALERLFTDVCAAKGWMRLLSAVPRAWAPAGVRRLQGRVPREIPPGKITAFNRMGMEYHRRLKGARTPSDQTEAFLWVGRAFCELIRKKGLGEANAIYTFSSASLELQRYAKELGLACVMDQIIAPKEIEQRLLDDEECRFPGWQQPRGADSHLSEFIDREKEEWSLADLIVCGSDFVRDGIVACGGPAERCVVVPYGIDSRPGNPQLVRRQSGLLKVLTVGSVGLRKGSPYVMHAAKKLKGRAHFRMVGPLDILSTAEKELREQVEVVGPVPRAEVIEHYNWADVFLLPSVCEGSAAVCYEALAAGLPVITTKNSGSVVTEGRDGFIVPTSDFESIIEKIELLSNNRITLQNMSENARMTGNNFTVSSYSARLFAKIEKNL